jgi:hypothetical protein
MLLAGKNEEKCNTQIKLLSSATLSTINPIKTGMGSNLSLCGERPVTNHLSHSMACFIVYYVQLPQDRNEWVTFMDIPMNVQVLKNRELLDWITEHYYAAP